MAVALATVRVPRVRRKPRKRRSEVQNLLSCPMWRPSESEEASFKAALHDAIARYLHACYASGETTRLADVHDIARAAFYAMPRGLDVGRWTEFLGIFDLWAHARPADPETIFVDPVTGVLGIEMMVEVEEDEAILYGTMDLVRRLDDGDASEGPTRLAVIDHKGQWPVDSHEFQMRFYAGLLCRAFPTVEEIVTVADHYRRVNGIVEVAYGRDECLEWWEDMLYGLGRYLAAPKRRAVGGRACRYCARRLVCGKALDPWKTMPANDAEAVAAYRDRVRLNAASSIIREGLKAYTDHRDPLMIDDRDVGWMLPDTVRYVVPQPQEVIAYLNTPHSRRGDEVSALVVMTDELTQDELDELQLAGLVRREAGRLKFQERKTKSEKVPEPGVPDEDSE
jgi:CRISPR/Cas system-associated exonuclease Cas4 (RecB family)